MRWAIGVRNGGRNVVTRLVSHRPAHSQSCHSHEISMARRLGKPPKDIENQRLTLEIECFNIARGLVEHLPYISDPVESRSVLRGASKTRCEPPVHCFYKGCQCRG